MKIMYLDLYCNEIISCLGGGGQSCPQLDSFQYFFFNFAEKEKSHIGPTFNWFTLCIFTNEP